MGPVTTEVAAHVGRTCELHGTRNLAVWRDPKIGNIEILRFMDLGKKAPGPSSTCHIHGCSIVARKDQSSPTL